MLKAKNMAKKVFEGVKHEPEWESKSYSQYRAVIEVSIANFQCRPDVVKHEAMQI
jgi:hypothetical protein